MNKQTGLNNPASIVFEIHERADRNFLENLVIEQGGTIKGHLFPNVFLVSSLSSKKWTKTSRQV